MNSEIQQFFRNIFNQIDEFDKRALFKDPVNEVENLLNAPQTYVSIDNFSETHSNLLRVCFYKVLISQIKQDLKYKPDNLGFVILIQPQNDEEISLRIKGLNFSNEVSANFISQLLLENKVLASLFTFSRLDGVMAYQDQVEESVQLQIRDFVRSEHKKPLDDYIFITPRRTKVRQILSKVRSFFQ